MNHSHAVLEKNQPANDLYPDQGNRYFRVDPHAQSHTMAVELAGSALTGSSIVKLEHDAVIVDGTLNCGLETSLRIPGSDFRGVAARLSLDEDNEILAEVVLLHRDASLNVPVACSHDMTELAADWQSWAKRFNLPLFLIEPDGVEQMISDRMGGLDVRPSVPRRSRALVAKRRPRFLVRRKAGVTQAEAKVAGREIIARD